MLSTADDAANHRPYVIHVIARRPSDGASTDYPSRYGGETVTTVFGNLLGTSRGCVVVEAYVIDASGHRGPVSRTACQR